MLSLFFFIYFPNRKKLFDYEKGRAEPVSIIVPCYNEAQTIGKTIESLLALDYPKNMIEIIIIDDKSTDNSQNVVTEYAKKYSNVKLIVNKRNSGGAAEPTNIGIKAAKYDFIAVTDADSSPQQDALKKMIGYLQKNEKVGAVTCAVMVKNQETFMQKLQAIEYVVISFSRKLLDFIDAVYVTPGPFALYRKKTLIQIGLFDATNLTQDIEIVWRLKANGYTAKMCLAAKVYSDAPKKFKAWWKQRVRWNIGGTQTIVKYKKLFFKKEMLGLFIIPFFTVSLFLGLFGLMIFFYLMFRRALVYYLSTRYSIYAQTAIFALEDLTFTPTVLNFFGAALFFLGLGFTMLVISTIKEKEIRNKKVFNLLFYFIVYLTVYPFISITSIYKFARKDYKW
ncbi:MAG: glycosyltransferase [Nanoarchaeota archaeon]